MKRKFALEKFCFFVKGAKRGAIYNLKSGDVYSIDENAVEFIESCEKGKSIEEIISGNFPLNRREIIEYCNKLKNQGLGHFIKENEKITKVKLSKPHPLEFMWLELTTKCNLRCEHCYSESDSEKREEEKMTFNNWLQVLEEGYKIGCRKIQFIGGEPLLLPKDLKTLIRKARSIGYKFIEVFTNGTLITEKWVKFFSENKVHVAISIYGPNARIHDGITHRLGSFNRSIKALRWLTEYQIPLRVAMIVMKKNQNFVESTKKFLHKNFGIQNLKHDLVRPSGRGCGMELVPEKLLEEQQIYEPGFSQCSKKDFERRTFGHQCFSKEICVTATGKVFPCIMERDLILGNVLSQNIKTIINSDSSLKIRRLNKDKIEVCKDCEYRYACFDCRPKAKGSSSNENLYAKPAECHYDPYEGRWND